MFGLWDFGRRGVLNNINIIKRLNLWIPEKNNILSMFNLCNVFNARSPPPISQIQHISMCVWGGGGGMSFIIVIS